MIATMNETQTANIGITDENRQSVAAILRRLLSNEYVLYTKTRNYHWNVTGPHFHSLHEIFEEQYTELETVVDDVAERCRSLGEPVIGTMQEFQQCATLREEPDTYPEAMTMVTNLVADYEQVIRELRNDLRACEEDFNDMGTSDFLTGLMEQHEKTAWMLRALAAE
jgi:starvation-inducible DNA-binding protein